MDDKDEIALKVLVGLLSGRGVSIDDETSSEYVKMAYQIADAMLVARRSGGSSGYRKK